MAALLSTQLDSLRRERERLEELLMLDANWRALRVLDARVATGERLEDLGGPERRAELAVALASNRIYAARAKLLETIELLSCDSAAGAGPDAGSLASRIVMLDAAAADTFRTRVRVKEPARPQTTAAPIRASEPLRPSEPARDAPPVLPDPLQLIDGLGRCAVELLHDGGVTRFEEISRWSSADVARWSTRLEGCAHGTTGAWIEQAAALAAGRPTRFSERARRGEFAALTEPPASEPPRRARHDLAASAPLRSRRVGPGEDVPAASAVLPAPARSAAQLTADELARCLADAQPAAPAAPPPLPPVPAEPVAVPVATAARVELRAASPAAATTGAVPLAELSPSRRTGYTRPRSMPAERPGEREAAAVSGAGEPASARGVQRAPEGRPRTLLRRLKDLREPQRFEAGSYAAYRGTVEEASVTIIRTAEPPPSAKTAPAEGIQKPAPASRFLRALTGKV